MHVVYTWDEVTNHRLEKSVTENLHTKKVHNNIVVLSSECNFYSNTSYTHSTMILKLGAHLAKG